MPKLQEQKRALFFIGENLENDQSILENVSRSGELRGRKILAKHEGMIANFKKRYGSRENLGRIRSSLSEEIAIEKKRISLENSKYHSLTKRAREERKNIIEQKSPLKNLDQTFAKFPKEKEPEDTNKVKQEAKMKQYLNLILRKTKNTKNLETNSIKRSESEIESNKSFNKFLRKMKQNQTKKKNTKETYDYVPVPQHSYQIRNTKRSFSQLDDCFLII